MHRRREKPEERRLLDEMARQTDPRQEAQLQLEHELATSAIARKAFGADLVALRRFRDLARANRRGLPHAVRTALDNLTRARDFDHLLELAEQADLPVGREPGMD